LERFLQKKRLKIGRADRCGSGGRGAEGGIVFDGLLEQGQGCLFLPEPIWGQFGPRFWGGYEHDWVGLVGDGLARRVGRIARF